MSSRVDKNTHRRKQKASANQPPPLKQAVEPRPNAAPPSAKLLSGRYRKQDLQVFQCSQCFNLLGDSLSLCGEDANLACLICLRVTKEVVMEKRLLFDLEGALAGSSYYPLFCRSCRLFLGFCLYSTYKRFAHLRSLFCLSKDKICCYLFESKKTVPASEVKFCYESLKSKFAEMQPNLVKAYVGVRILTSQHEEALKVESDQEQGKMATDEMKTKTSPDGPET